MEKWLKLQFVLLILQIVSGESEELQQLHFNEAKGGNRNLLKEINRDKSFDTEPGESAFQLWNEKTCSDVLHLFTVTSKAIKSIKGEIRSKSKSKDETTRLKVRVLQMLSDELIESERWIFSALHMLKETVRSSAANSLDRIATNAKARLEELQYATMIEEEKFDKLNVVLGQIRDVHIDTAEHNLFYDIIQDVLTDVELAADLLEENLREKIVPFKAEDIETVKKLESKNDNDLSVHLEDVHGNRYVISLPADKTQPLTDHALLFSILIMLVMAGVLSGLCHVCHVPTIFGQILTGVLLGPSCLNLILDPVQMETVGELGVFLILFCCGLEFSPTSFVKVWRVSVCGSLFIISLITIVFTACGSMFHISIYQSMFVALCLSFSSTALVIKFLNDDTGEDVMDLRNSMMGMLVLQDVEVSLIMGCLPFLAEHAPHHNLLHTNSPVRKLQALQSQDPDQDRGTVIFVFLFGLLSILIVGVLGRRFLGSAVRFLYRPSTSEINTLLPVALCFGVTLILAHYGVSMEVGCFLSGVMMKSLNRGEQTQRLIEPVRDVFSLIFFTTIGLHVYPQFVWSQIVLIVLLTLFVVSIKYLVCLLVLKPLTSELQRSVISAGLAQVSEFSFVLASRGRKLQLINREVYLIILSVTATSLILSPIIWKVSLIHTRKKKLEMPHVS
ncbi:hypothetical protein ACHWQZ_G019112 [Mnemiopsis leidyi]